MTAAANDTFYIGFALSGAISAGAYTAGVLDFFFQALNEWEKARGVPGTPGHRVDVQVVTGASAGAITGALGVVALARGMRPQKLSAIEKQNTHPIESETAQDVRCVLPSLYETWVTRPRLVDPNGGIDFLSGEDLESGKDAAVVSVLNAELLDRIKEEALLASASGQAPEAQPPYAYIAENLHVYMTVSNLRGIPFTVSFGNSTYGMQTHGDRVHYTISGLGNGVSTKNAWVCADTGEPLAVGTLPPVGDKKLPDTWDRYGTCALASSAFPIGLAPREIAAPISGYRKRSYPMARGAAALEPDFPKPWLATLGSKEFVFLNVDGGVINNNPFDYAQYALMGDSEADKTGADNSDRAVIMVSPFPEPPAFLPDDQPAAELVAVIRALFPALIDQSRFKTAELVPAMDPDDHSRFLIAPHRNIGGVEQRYKIACGLLGGFGGFLDEDFRAHDFQLGRRNCQAFLRSTFGLSPNSDIVASLRGRKEFELSAPPEKYAIVPRLGHALPEVALPQWPRMSQADFTVLRRRIKGRLDKLAPRFVQAQTASRFFRALGRIGLRLGQKRVLEYARLAILSDLIRRDQIEGWELPPMPGKSVDDVRLILAELADPAFTFRTAEGIARRTHLEPSFVTGVLAQLETVDDSRPFLVWQGKFEGQQVFTLASRKPGWLRSLPGISQILNLLEAPTID